MNFLESHRLLPCVAGLAISAALLWLAAEIFAVARTRVRSAGLRLKACAVLLGGFGLWWPGHFLAPLDSGSVLGIPFLAGGLAWGLAGLALITAVAATRKTVPAFAGLAVITLLVAYAHSVFATPGLFRATVVLGAWGPGIAVFVLVTLLVGLGLEFKPSRKLRAIRIASALLCAILLTLAASVSAETDPATVPAWAEAVLIGALIGLALAMLEALHSAGTHDDELPRRTVSAAPTVDSLTQLPTRRRTSRTASPPRPPRPMPAPAGSPCCSSTSTASSRSTTPTATARRHRARAGRPAPEVDLARQGRRRPRRRRRVPAPAQQRRPRRRRIAHVATRLIAGPDRSPTRSTAAKS